MTSDSAGLSTDSSPCAVALPTSHCAAIARSASP
jgi:hypothetical protein